MNKENNRSAAGLRRSAVAERIRLREEWSALKGIDAPTTSKQRVLTKKPMTLRCSPRVSKNLNCGKVVASSGMESAPNTRVSGTALCGVVALVEVGEESRALPLRAALTALGATVVGCWIPLVTHLVWAEGGNRSVRAKARVLGCRLVSPLWVEACAASNTKLNERTFPTASRQSDLPSPRTLRQLLKRAEVENIPLIDLLSDSKEDDKDGKPKPLRISTDTEQDTSADKTTDTSNDTIDIESRINTAPRRALPNTSVSIQRPAKSRRKLFTQKEAELAKNSSEDESETTMRPRQKRVRVQNGLTQKEKKDLARAERMAKKILATCTTQDNRCNNTQTNMQLRIVLTGMSRTQRQTITQAIQQLNGRIQNHVTKRTTHVLLGSCRNDTNITLSTINTTKNNCNQTNRSNRFDITGVTSLRDVKNKDNSSSATNYVYSTKNNVDSTTNNVYSTRNNVGPTMNNGQSTTNYGDSNKNNVNSTKSSGCMGNNNFDNNDVDKKARTVNALQGAARGCRVLHARWAIDSVEAGKWLHHHGYEVHHLRKIFQKARVERTALGRTHSDYAYDVFNGMRVRISHDAEQKDAATQLLKLCGAIVVEDDQNCRRLQDDGRTQDVGRTQNGGRTQDGGYIQNCGQSIASFQFDRCFQNGGRSRNGGSNCDIVIGSDIGEVSSKWVFDSVAAARMRTTRRYINANDLAQRDR